MTQRLCMHLEVTQLGSVPFALFSDNVSEAQATYITDVLASHMLFTAELPVRRITPLYAQPRCVISFAPFHQRWGLTDGLIDIHGQAELRIFQDTILLHETQLPAFVVSPLSVQLRIKLGALLYFSDIL